MSDESRRDVGLILVAAGRSRRMGGGSSKVLREIGGRPVLSHSLRLLPKLVHLRRVVLVVRGEDESIVRQLVAECVPPGVDVHLVHGGDERQDSVRAGLEPLRSDPQVAVVLVHDAARPLATAELFEAVAAAARQEGVAVPAVAVADTLRRQSESGLETVPRDGLYAVQTPQGFQKAILLHAHDHAPHRAVTDDAMMAEALGHPVTLVPGDPRNFKLTTQHDLDLAEALLVRGPSEQEGESMRIGLGQDLHRLQPGGPLRLGGVDVESDCRAVGHSDGDALLHAITDAVLGALALGDIGQHFSDRDPAHHGRDSATMLARALELARERGYRPRQLDSVVHLERPRLAQHRERMRQRLATLLGLDVADVSVKAKTAEGLGDIGAGRAISCEALVRMVPAHGAGPDEHR